VTTGEIRSQQTGGLNAPGHLQTHGSDAFYKAKPFHANPLAVDAWKTVSLTAPATRETFLLTPRQKQNPGSREPQPTPTTNPSGLNRGSGAA
jgi:hypothetical protein